MLYNTLAKARLYRLMVPKRFINGGHAAAGGNAPRRGTAYHDRTALSSDRVPVDFVPRGGVDERFVELTPQILTVADIVHFCHLTNPIVGKVQVGSVVLAEGGQLKQSVGE